MASKQDVIMGIMGLFTQLSPQWNRWKISSKFQLFFVLTAILPILVFCWIFFDSVNTRFQQRIENLLQSGRLFAQDFLIDNQTELELLASQLANMQGSDLVNSRQAKAIESMFDRYEDTSAAVEFTILVDKHGKEVARSQQARQLAGIPYEPVIQKALAGQVNSSIESLPTLSLRQDTAQHRLIYLAAAPIYTKDVKSGQRGIHGVLLVGQYLEPNREFRQLTSILPEDKFRFYVKTPAAFHLAFSNIQNDQRISTDPLQQHLRRCAQVSSHCDTLVPSFMETFNEMHYASKAYPIENISGDAVGYLVVSTSKDDIEQLERENLLMLAAFLLVALVFIILLGYWFESRVMAPLQKLSDVSKQVAAGNLEERVEEHTAEGEMHSTIASFNKMLDQLRENEKYRSTFISTLTHDLRTPLLAQKRVLEIFNHELKTTAQTELQHLCQGLLKNNEQLLHMVNQMLSANEYEGGKVRLLLEPKNLHELVDECCYDLSALAQSKQITVLNQIPVDFPTLTVDAVHLKRVFINLIGNALENIPVKGQIRIGGEDGDHHVQVIVEDDGPGVSPNILPHLFERYTGGAKNCKKIGTGLGLYICKMIIELHHGRIVASTPSGGGLRFAITLWRPVKSAEKSPQLHNQQIA